MGEGQVHQTHPEEGIKVREQICQTAREGGQVRFCQPAETVQVIPTQQLFDFHIKNVVWTVQNYFIVLYITVVYSAIQYSTAYYCTVQYIVVHGVLLTDSCPNRLYSVSLLLFVLLM